MYEEVYIPSNKVKRVKKKTSKKRPFANYDCLHFSRFAAEDDKTLARRLDDKNAGEASAASFTTKFVNIFYGYKVTAFFYIPAGISR